MFRCMSRSSSDHMRRHMYNSTFHSNWSSCGMRCWNKNMWNHIRHRNSRSRSRTHPSMNSCRRCRRSPSCTPLCRKNSPLWNCFRNRLYSWMNSCRCSLTSSLPCRIRRNRRYNRLSSLPCRWSCRILYMLKYRCLHSRLRRSRRKWYSSPPNIRRSKNWCNLSHSRRQHCRSRSCHMTSSRWGFVPVHMMTVPVPPQVLQWRGGLQYRLYRRTLAEKGPPGISVFWT